MSSFKVHCMECEQKLGYAYPQVHKFLDQYAYQYKGSKLHRRILHNKKGLMEIEKRWGVEAKEAGLIHIKRDEKENAVDIVRNMSMIGKSNMSMRKGSMRRRQRRKW